MIINVVASGVGVTEWRNMNGEKLDIGSQQEENPMMALADDKTFEEHLQALNEVGSNEGMPEENKIQEPMTPSQAAVMPQAQERSDVFSFRFLLLNTYFLIYFFYNGSICE